MDDSELWMSSEEDEDEDGEYGPIKEDATFFTLDLRPEGQSGEFHVRNRHGGGETQRMVASQFHSGPQKRPAFSVGAVAKAIVHGTLDSNNRTPATLLVYDFSFFSYRSSRRIKDASISFEFRANTKNKKTSSGLVGPTVAKVAPFGRHVMMQTTETVTRTNAAEAGILGGTPVGVNVGANAEKSVEKTTTHAASVVGNNPCDEWSNYFLAQWFLEENESQRNGIVTLFRACILLTREEDGDDRQGDARSEDAARLPCSVPARR